MISEKADTLAIVVTYNGMQWIDRCISSLLQYTAKPDIFVVDNASTDGTPDYIETAFKGVILHRSSENLGFGAANNIGFRYALDNGYDYVYLINQDAWVKKDTIELLQSVSRANPQYAVLSPIHLERDEDKLDQRFLYNTICTNRDIVQDLLIGSPLDVYPVDLVAAAHWLLPRRTLEAVGGFSPSFYHYGEDYNYADRVRFKGMKLGVVPCAKAIHDRGDNPFSKKREIRCSAMLVVRELSNPGLTSLKIQPYAFRTLCLKDVRRFRSFSPVSYFFWILSHFSTITKNKKISESEPRAFL